MPNNPPANPIPGAVYVDQSTNLSWVWTGTYWLRAGGSSNYNSQVGTGATIVPGFFAEPSPDSWVPHVGPTAPGYPSCGQIWIDTSVTPNSSYVWDCNTNTHVLLAGGDPSASSAVVSTVAPTTRPNGNSLEVGDLWIDANTQVISYWNGSAWLPASSPDTNSIPSAITPTTRADGSALQAGDIWADINSNLLYFYNGTSFATIVAQSDDHQIATSGPTTSPSGAVLSDGDRWTDSTTGNHYYYEAGLWVPYNDTHSQVSTVAPTTRATGDALRDGDQWFDSTLKLLYVWEVFTASWTRIGSDTHSFVQNGQPTLTVRPNGDTLLTGDQYIDSATHKLWYWTGTVWEVASKDLHSFTGNGIPALATRPDGAALVAGDQYLDLVGNDLYGYNGSGWVPFISPNTHSFTGSGAPSLVVRPDASPLIAGDEFIDITTDIQYYWNGTAWEFLSRDLHSFTGLIAPTIIQRPDGNPLIEGDQYINKTTNDSYFWDSAAWVLIGGDTHSIRATTAPTTRIDGTPLRDGDQWVDTDNQNAFYVYNIGTAAWEILGDDSHSFAGAGAPTLTVRPNGQALQAGDQWLNTTTKYLYGWDGAVWSIIGVDTHSFSGAADPALTTRPDGTTLLTGDQYLNSTTKILFGWDGAAWNVISGDTHSILGAGDPTTTNPTITRPSGSPLKNGDLYIDTSAQESYYYSTGTSTWTKYTAPDTHSFTGAGEPVAANPVTTRPDGSPLVQGDMYVDTATKFTYGYLSGAWAQLGSSDTHSFSGNGTPFIAAPSVGTNSITVRPDNGLPLTDGDQYFDKNTNILYLYTGAEWIAGADDTHSFHQGALGTVWPTITTRPDGTPLRDGDLATADDNRLFSYNPVYSGFREVIGTYYHSIMSTWLDPNGNITDRQDGAVTGLYNGDMYIDEQSKRIWFRDGANWKEIERDGHSFTASGAPTLIKRPADAYAYEAALETGDQYINTDDGQLYYWNGSSWQKSGLPDTHSFTGGANPTLTVRPDGTALLTGDQFINTATDALWYWNGTAWETLSTTDTHSFTGTVDPDTAGSLVDSGNRPDGSALVSGDQYININTNVLFSHNGTVWGVLNNDRHSFTASGTPYISAPSVGTNSITTRPNGTSLLTGDQYVDTATDFLYYYNGAEWEPLSSVDTHSFTGGANPTLTVRPDGTALLTGDQFINTTTDALWYWDGSAWTTEGIHDVLVTQTAYTGTNPITVTETAGVADIAIPSTSNAYGTRYYGTVAPTSPADGDIWYDPAGNVSYDFHSFSGSGAPTLTSKPSGETLQVGDQYTDTTSSLLYYWNGAAWNLLTNDTHSIAGNGTPTLTTRPSGQPLQAGDQYTDIQFRRLYHYNNSSWEEYAPSTPVGTVIYSAQSSVPFGYLKANGSSLSTTTYPELFAAIGTAYGGSGGNFNVPDLRGEFIRGWDDGRGIDTGRSLGSAQSDDFKSHNHDFLSPPGDANDPSSQGYTPPGGGRNAFRTSDRGSSTETFAAIVARGGTETRPRNVALMALIKYL